VGRGGRANSGDLLAHLLAHLVERLAKERVDVGVSPGSFDGGV
jgi:hypothetical protein